MNTEARRAFWEAVFLVEVQFRTPADVADKADACLAEWIKRWDPELVPVPARPPPPPTPPDDHPDTIKIAPIGETIWSGGKAYIKGACTNALCDPCKRLGYHLSIK